MVIAVPPGWRPVAEQAVAAAVVPPQRTSRPDAAPCALVVPTGVPVALREARAALLRAHGWAPAVVSTAGGGGSWERSAAEADRVLAALRREGPTGIGDADVWAGEPEDLVVLAEQLWHHGVRFRVLLDPRVASSRLLALLAGAAPLDATAAALAAAVAEACAQADAVVLAAPCPTPLLGGYRGPWGSVAVLPAGAPAAVAAPPVALGAPAPGREPGADLSVLVTTHDREDALAACLEALCRQTLGVDRFEVVVVDDGSPRPPVAVVERFADRLPVRLVVLEENLGPGGARTRGLDHVTAAVTLLMDDDDVPAPRCLEEHLLAHRAHPQEEVAVLGATSVLPGGRVSALSRHVTTVGRQYFAYPGVQRGEVHPWRAFWCGRSSAKTSLLRRHAFRVPLMEDADFAFRARGDGLRVVHARRALQVVTDRLELAHFRRRQNRIGQAMVELAQRCADDEVWTWAGLQPVAANLQRWSQQQEAVDRVVTELLEVPLHRLRAAHHPSGSLLTLLDAALLVDLDAHYAAGALAALARRRADGQGRPLRVGARAEDPGLPALLEGLAAAGTGSGLAGVVLARGGAAAAVRAAVAAAGAADVVEVRASGPDLALHDDVDVVLPASLDPHWRPGRPVPLLGQGTAAWLHQLTSTSGPVGSLR